LSKSNERVKGEQMPLELEKGLRVLWNFPTGKLCSECSRIYNMGLKKQKKFAKRKTCRSKIGVGIK
jgi:hypothetical protein